MNYAYFPTPPPPTYDFYTEPFRDDAPNGAQEDYSTDPLTAYDEPAAFTSFDPSFQLDHTALQSPPQTQLGVSGPGSTLHESSASTEAIVDFDSTDAPNFDALPYEGPAGSAGLGSDEDKQTPELQAKRKAQNRAAQRAFRERKLRHVQALKEQLNSTTAKMKNIETDFERLQRENERLATQNEILRATSKPQSHPQPQVAPSEREVSPIPGPQRYSPSAAFRANLMSATLQRHPPQSKDDLRAPAGTTGTYRLDVSAATGQKLLSMSAAWELVQNHELYKKGQINIHELCEKMKAFSTCNGHGPAFPEDALLTAIEESIGGPGDELL